MNALARLVMLVVLVICGAAAAAPPPCPSGCPDDYRQRPYPRACTPVLPPFYKCVPAGEGRPKPARIAWWFLPTPEALRRAVWPFR